MTCGSIWPGQETQKVVFSIQNIISKKHVLCCFHFSTLSFHRCELNNVYRETLKNSKAMVSAGSCEIQFPALSWRSNFSCQYLWNLILLSPRSSFKRQSNKILTFQFNTSMTLTFNLPTNPTRPALIIHRYLKKVNYFHFVYPMMLLSLTRWMRI